MSRQQIRDSEKYPGHKEVLMEVNGEPKWLPIAKKLNKPSVTDLFSQNSTSPHGTDEPEGSDKSSAPGATP